MQARARQAPRPARLRRRAQRDRCPPPTSRAPRSSSWPATPCALARVTARRSVRRPARPGRARHRRARAVALRPGRRRASTAEQATEWCKAGEAAALAARPAHHQLRGRRVRRRQPSGRVRLEPRLSRLAIARSSCSLSVVPVATQNGTMQRDYWYSVQRHLAGLESPGSDRPHGRARARCADSARARSRPARCPVVFDPDMAAQPARATSPAPSPATRSTGACRSSPASSARRSRRRSSPSSTTARCPAALGSRPFDGEGLPTRRTPVVERGVLTSYLLDTYSARKLQSRSTGNAARSIGDSPRVSPTNFYPRRRRPLARGRSSPRSPSGSTSPS